MPKLAKPKPLQPWSPEPTTIEHVERRAAYPGWFLSDLIRMDYLFSGRWAYWLDILETGRLPNRQIPQIRFASDVAREPSPYTMPDEQLTANIETSHSVLRDWGRLLDYGSSLGGERLHTLIEWWLYAFGDPLVPVKPKLKPKMEIALFQSTLIPRMMAHPGDWGSRILMEYQSGKGRQGTGWFPTPMCVTQLLVQMTFPAGDCRTLSVFEPCMGTGVMLLASSNYSLNLAGCDIDPEMVAWAKFQGYLYAPWLVTGNRSTIAALAAAHDAPIPVTGPYLFAANP